MDEYPEPKTATVKQLYGSAFRCAHPECSKPLYRVNDETGDLILNSRVAHIHARRNGGPRWIEMPPEMNQATANLVLLCIEHSYEVDEPGREEIYTADVLREWKARQLDEYQRIQRNWPLSDAEVAEVIAASFSHVEAHTALRVDLSRAIGAVIADARRGRAGPRAEIDAWQATVRRVNASVIVFDDNGQRGSIEPSRNETESHRQRVLAALDQAQQTLAPKADQVRSEITAAAAERPDLVPWMEALLRALAAVEHAVARWPSPPPFTDDDVLARHTSALEQALSELVRRWQGDASVATPVAPAAPVEPAEDEDARRLREHDELLERARPHARVQHLAADSDLFDALCAALPYAAGLPQIVSHLARGLSATATLAAAAIRNGDDAMWLSAIAKCATTEPLAAGVFLARGVSTCALEAEQNEIAAQAKKIAVDRLAKADWADIQTWVQSLNYVSSLLSMAASELGEDVVERWLSEALAHNPELVPWMLVGFAQVSEPMDPGLQEAPVRYSWRTGPSWIPSAELARLVNANGAAVPDEMVDSGQRESVAKLASAASR